MIYLKTSDDLKLMKKAGEIAAGALKAAENAIKPGVSTLYIDKVIYDYITLKGGIPSCLGYGGFPASSCISINEEVIHGIPSKAKIIKDGDIVSVDITASYKGFHGDNTATFAVGSVEERVLKLLEATKNSLAEAIKQAVVGNRIGDISNAVQTYAESRGYSVVREYVGHGIGKDMHESPSVPNFGKSGHGRRLEAGMTIAIEPMINLGCKEVRVLDDGWTVVTADGECSAHFEHTVAITENGPIILTLI